MSKENNSPQDPNEALPSSPALSLEEKAKEQMLKIQKRLEEIQVSELEKDTNRFEEKDSLRNLALDLIADRENEKAKIEIMVDKVNAILIASASSLSDNFSLEELTGIQQNFPRDFNTVIGMWIKAGIISPEEALEAASKGKKEKNEEKKAPLAQKLEYSPEPHGWDAVVKAISVDPQRRQRAILFLTEASRALSRIEHGWNKREDYQALKSSHDRFIAELGCANVKKNIMPQNYEETRKFINYVRRELDADNQKMFDEEAKKVEALEGQDLMNTLWDARINMLQLAAERRNTNRNERGSLNLQYRHAVQKYNAYNKEFQQKDPEGRRFGKYLYDQGFPIYDASPAMLKKTDALWKQQNAKGLRTMRGAEQAKLERDAARLDARSEQGGTKGVAKAPGVVQNVSIRGTEKSSISHVRESAYTPEKSQGPRWELLPGFTNYPKNSKEMEVFIYALNQIPTERFVDLYFSMVKQSASAFVARRPEQKTKFQERMENDYLQATDAKQRAWMADKFIQFIRKNGFPLNQDGPQENMQVLAHTALNTALLQRLDADRQAASPVSPESEVVQENGKEQELNESVEKARDLVNTKGVREALSDGADLSAMDIADLKAIHSTAGQAKSAFADIIKNFSADSSNEIQSIVSYAKRYFVSFEKRLPILAKALEEKKRDIV